MDLDFDDTRTRHLRGYVRQVSDALGLSPECCCVQGERPSNAYVALDGQLPDFPGRDVALLWDERRGWSVAVETQELFLVEHYGDDPTPEPQVVAKWVGSVVA